MDPVKPEQAVRFSEGAKSLSLLDFYDNHHTDPEVVEQLNIMRAFLSRMYLPYNSIMEQPKSAQLENAHRAFKFAIINFDKLLPITKKVLLETLDLIDTAKDFFDQNTKDEYQLILDIFDDKDIMKAQKVIGKFFVPGAQCKDDKFALAITVTSIAMNKLIPKLSQNTKCALLRNIQTQMTQVIDNYPPESQDNFNKIKNAFSSIDWSSLRPPERKITPSSLNRKDSLATKNPQPLTSTEILDGEKVAKQQLAKIASIFHAITEQYLPDIFINDKDISMKKFMRSTLPQFDKLFTPLVAKYCFKEPSEVSMAEKEILSHVIKQMNVFFGHMMSIVRANATISTLSTISHLDILKTNLMQQTMGMQLKKGETFNLEKSQELLHSALFEELKGLFGLFLHLDTLDPVSHPLHEMGQYVLVMTTMVILRRTMTPYTIALIIERFIDDHFSPNGGKTTKPVAVNLDDEDTKFSIGLGEQINRMITSVLDFGDPDTISKKAVVGALGIIISHEKSTIGASILKYIKELKGSHCTITPFLVLQHLLFHEEKGKLSATMLPNQLPTQKEVDLKRLEVGKKIETKVFPMIEKMVKESMSQSSKNKSDESNKAAAEKETGFFGFFNDIADGLKNKAVETALSSETIQSYCKGLNQRVWMLTQDEEIIEVLLLFLIRGLRLGLIEGLKPAKKAIA